MTRIIYRFYFAAGFSRTWCYNLGLPGGWPWGSWCTPTTSSTTRGCTTSSTSTPGWRTSTPTASTLPGRRAASSSSPARYGWWSPAASASHDARRSAHAPGVPRHRLSVQPAGWGAAARDEGEEEVQPADPAQTGQLDQGKGPIHTECKRFVCKMGLTVKSTLDLSESYRPSHFLKRHSFFYHLKMGSVQFYVTVYT